MVSAGDVLIEHTAIGEVPGVGRRPVVDREQLQRRELGGVARQYLLVRRATAVFRDELLAGVRVVVFEICLREPGVALFGGDLVLDPDRVFGVDRPGWLEGVSPVGTERFFHAYTVDYNG